MNFDKTNDEKSKMQVENMYKVFTEPFCAFSMPNPENNDHIHENKVDIYENNICLLCFLVTSTIINSIESYLQETPHDFFSDWRW